jgi:hypothetical protein
MSKAARLAGIDRTTLYRPHGEDTASRPRRQLRLDGMTLALLQRAHVADALSGHDGPVWEIVTRRCGCLPAEGRTGARAERWRKP